jgi:hypothetical protein
MRQFDAVSVLNQVQHYRECFLEHPFHVPLQLRTGGVIEVLRMCRARFSSRMLFADFCSKYRFVLPAGVLQLSPQALALLITRVAEVVPLVGSPRCAVVISEPLLCI